MTWLHCQIEKTPEYCIVSCIVLFPNNMKTGYMNEFEAHFMCLWVAGNHKTSNVMVYAILSIVIAKSLSMTTFSYMTVFNI